MERSENASSIPENHRKYATYKKYLAPDKSFAFKLARSRDQSLTHERIGYVTAAQIHASTILPLANSPPVGVFAHSHTRTPTTDSSVVMGNNLGGVIKAWPELSVG